MKKSLTCHKNQQHSTQKSPSNSLPLCIFPLLFLFCTNWGIAGENGSPQVSPAFSSECSSALLESPFSEAKLSFSDTLIARTLATLKSRLKAFAGENPTLLSYASMNKTQETLLTKFLAQVAGPEVLFVGVKLVGNGIRVDIDTVKRVLKVDAKSSSFHSLEIQFSSEIENATLAYNGDARLVQIPVSEMLGMTQNTVHVLTRSLVSHPLHPQILTSEKLNIRKQLGLPEKYPKAIQNQASQVIENGIGSGQQSLLIVGPPGLGKTKILDEGMKVSLLNKAFRAYISGKPNQPIFAIVAADSRLVWDQLFQQIAKQHPERKGITLVTWGNDTNSHTPEQVAELLRRNQSVILISVTRSLVAKTKDPRIRKQFVESLNGFFFDEAHHLGATKTWPLFFEFKAGPKKPFMFGMTATPIHADRDIQQAFDGYAWWAYLDAPSALTGKVTRSLDDIVEQMRRARLLGDITPIERVFLLSAKSLDPRNPSRLPLFLPERDTSLWKPLDSKRNQMDDDEDAALDSDLAQERQDLRLGSRRVFNPLLNRELIELLHPALLAHHGVLFVASTIPQANQFVEDLRASGVPAAAFHSKMSKEERKWVDQKFKDKVVHSLVTVRAYDEGVDRSHLSMMVDLNPEIAAKNFWQRIGRLTRLDIGKQITYVSFISTSAAERRDQLALVEYLLSRKLHRLGDEYGPIAWNPAQANQGLSGLFLSPDGKFLSLNSEFNMAELQALKLLMEQEAFWKEEKEATSSPPQQFGGSEDESSERKGGRRRKEAQVNLHKPKIKLHSPLPAIVPNPMREASRLLADFKTNTSTIQQGWNFPKWHPGNIFLDRFKEEDLNLSERPFGIFGSQFRFLESLRKGQPLSDRIPEAENVANEPQPLSDKQQFFSDLVHLASIYMEPSIQMQMILDPIFARTLEIYFVGAAFHPEIREIPHWEHLFQLVANQFLNWASDWVENFDELEIKIPSPTRDLGYVYDRGISLTLAAELLIVDMAMRPPVDITGTWPLSLQEYVLDSRLPYPPEALQLVFNPSVIRAKLLVPDASRAEFAGNLEAAVNLYERSEDVSYESLAEIGVPITKHTSYFSPDYRRLPAKALTQRTLGFFSRPQLYGSDRLLAWAQAFQKNFASHHGLASWNKHLAERQHLFTLYTWIDHSIKPESKVAPESARAMTLHEVITQLGTEKIKRTLSLRGKSEEYSGTYFDIFFQRYLDSLSGYYFSKSFGKLEHMPHSLVEESYVYAGRIVIAGIEPFLNSLSSEVRFKTEVFLTLLWLAPQDIVRSKSEKIKETIRRRIGAHFNRNLTGHFDSWWMSSKAEETASIANTIALFPLFTSASNIQVKYNVEIQRRTLQSAVSWGPATLVKLFNEHGLRFLNTSTRKNYTTMQNSRLRLYNPLQILRNHVRTCVDDLEVIASGNARAERRDRVYEINWFSGLEPNLPIEGKLVSILKQWSQIYLDLQATVLETQGIEAWKEMLNEDIELLATGFALNMGLSPYVQEENNIYNLPDGLFQRIKALQKRESR